MNYSRDDLEDNENWSIFKRWVKENLCEPDIFDKIDWDMLVDRSLSFEEAIDEIRRQLPSIWVDTKKAGERIKKIVFIKPLIEKIKQGEVQVTYRNKPKTGVYYVVSNRFKGEEPEVFIEFYKNEVVDVDKLTDREAQLAGVETADELRRLLFKWYGRGSTIYRNWFRVRHVD